MNFTSTDKRKRDQAIETAAILLFSAIKNNDKTGAIIFSDTIETYIPPKKGRGHVLRILRELLSQYENNSYKKSNQYQALKFFNAVMRKHCIAFFLSDQITADSRKLLSIANQKHDLVFVQISDPFEQGRVLPERMHIENPETGKSTVVDLSHNRVRVKFKQRRQEKQEALEKLLLQHNIDRVDISTDTHIYKEFLKFFKIRQLRQ
jgi:uncharacterized protein (DUF58 family)